MIILDGKLKRFLKWLSDLVTFFLVFLSGGSFVYFGLASSLIRQVKNLSREKSSYELVDIQSERDYALKYLSKINTKPFSKDLIYKGLSLPPNFDSLNIVATQLIEDNPLGEGVVYSKYSAKLNNGFQFSYLEVQSKVVSPKRDLIFLHGNKCSPEELLGLGKSKSADSVALDLAKAGIRVLIPIKYDMNQFNYSKEITISAAIHGSTFEALEQMKIKGIYNLYSSSQKPVAIYGFSHGAWQALLAANLNSFKIYFFHDYLINPKIMNPEDLSFYTDYDVGVASIYNYSEAFKNSEDSEVIVLLGKSSVYTDKNFVESITKKLNDDKVQIIYYEGGHYISRDLIKNHVIDRVW